MWRASIVLAAAVAASAVEASCEIGGVSIGNGVRFITGSHGVDGSIYAQCIDGKARCFMDNRVRDHNAGEEVSCDDATINASRRKLGVYLSDSVKYWPQGVACYSYGSAFTDAQKSVFQQAMNEYHTKTSIRFVTLSECSTTYGNNPNVCGGCTQAFQIVSKGGPSDCYATLGYAPSQRMDLNFGPSCFGGDGGFRVAVHELGHVLGLIHEHTHPNRAVVVLRDSLTLSADNYIKETHGLTTQYDPSSIMHYGRDTGLCVPLDKTKNYCDIDQTAADGCVEPTVSMCDASADNSFGRGPSLSTTDLATLARMYGSGGAATPAPAPVPATTAPAPATPAPTTAPTPVPVPPTETPAPAVVPTVTPAPVPTPAPAPAPETQPTEAPATPEPAPTPSPTDDNFKQQGDADSQQGGEADNSFHQWQAGGSDEVAGEATEGLSLGQGMAGQVSAPEEPRSADASPKQVVIPPQAQPATVPVAVPQPLPAADAGPKSQATTPLKPTRPKGKLCQ